MDEDRNTTGIYGDHREAPYDMTRDARLQLLTKTALTDATKNTVKEDLILETVENFRAQYVALYPTRAPLLLSPHNEYGCRKFISTFIRPSQLKFDELYDWYTLAKFIANYIQYEELTEPSTFPTTVTSPTTTMQWQIGNCIEMAILLASLLIGDGYDAYVCLGYAKKAICLNDLSTTPWPDALPTEVNPDDVVTERPKPASDYVQCLKERPKLISQFDEAERKQGGAMYKVLSDEGNANENEGQDVYSSQQGNNNNNSSGGGGDENRLVHAWVMVKPDRRSLARPDANLFARLNLQTTVPFLGIPSTTIFHESVLPNVGGRAKNAPAATTTAATAAALNKDKDAASSGEKQYKNIAEPIFIEPATGMYVRVADIAATDKYYGIEAIFNKENYFVNMSPELPVNKLTTDLRDLTAWERIFLADPNINSGADEDATKGTAAGGSRLAATVSGVAGVGKASLNNTVTGLASTAASGAFLGSGTLSLEPTNTVGEGGDQTLDLQLTWLPPITLTLAQYANRYPDRQKTIVYSGVTVEMFAEYSEPDLKVLVVTIEEEASATHGFGRGREVHTFYKHRSDRMRRKSIYPSPGSGEAASISPFGRNKNNNSTNAAVDKFKFAPNYAPVSGGGGQHHYGGAGGGRGGVAGGPSALLNAVSYVTHYWFGPGRMQEGAHRVEGLRELIIEPGKHRTMRFYWKSRDDGLATRIERFSEASRNTPIKVKEYYKGRTEDFLVYRSAKYDLPREGGGGLGGVAALSAMTASKDHRHDPIKMSEKFARNPNIPIDSDVEKRVFTKPQSNEGEIWTKYRYRPGCITRGIRLYPKNFDREKDLTAAAMIAKDQGKDTAIDVQPYVVLMPGMEKPKDTDLLNELRVLVDKESECLNEIRARADDCRDILAHLNLDRDDQNNGRNNGYGGPKSSASATSDKDKNQRDTALVSIFDTLRGRAKESEAEIAQRKAEEQRRAESRKDYLAPFIAKQENMAKICKGDYTNAKLSLEVARKVRDEAIADLKERLIERGHIMQTRLDREREDLMRRQMAFQKAIDGSDGTKESEEFSKFGKEATWRIRILEERLSNYIKSSADKYRQLADKLANDKRLAALYATGDQR